MAPPSALLFLTLRSLSGARRPFAWHVQKFRAVRQLVFGLVERPNGRLERELACVRSARYRKTYPLLRQLSSPLILAVAK